MIRVFSPVSFILFTLTAGLVLGIPQRTWAKIPVEQPSGVNRLLLIIKISSHETAFLRSFKVFREGRKHKYLFDERGIALLANFNFQEDKINGGVEFVGGSFEGSNSSIVRSLGFDLANIGSVAAYQDPLGNVVKTNALIVDSGVVQTADLEIEDVDWVLQRYDLGRWTTGVQMLRRGTAKRDVDWDRATPVSPRHFRKFMGEPLEISSSYYERLILIQITNGKVIGKIVGLKKNYRDMYPEPKPVTGNLNGNVLKLIERAGFGIRRVFEGRIMAAREHGYEFLRFVADETTVGKAAKKRVEQLLRKGSISTNAKEVCAVLAMWDIWQEERTWAKDVLIEALVDRSLKPCATKAILTALKAGADRGATVMSGVPTFERMGLGFSDKQKMRLARKAFDENPTCRNAYYLERVIKMGERRKKVPPLYELCLRQDDNEARYATAAEFFMNVGHYNRALSLFKDGLTLQSKQPNIHRLMGKIYLLQDKKKDAIAAYRKAAAMSKFYLHYLGDACTSIGDFDCALESYTSAPILAGAQKSWRFGKMYFLKGDIEPARKHMTQAVIGFVAEAESKPDSVWALSSAAWMLATVPFAELRDGSRALQLATRAVEITKEKEPKPLSRLAAALAELGRWSEATKNAKKALALCKKQYYDCSGFSREYQSIRSRNPIRDPRKD